MNQVGLAQVGIGYWGKNILRNLQNLPDTRFVVACDQDESTRRQAQSHYPGIRVTPHFSDLLADTSIAGIVISTPTDRHFELASKALRAGKHVFVEKPMTRTATEGEELVRISESEDRILMVGHLLLYHPAFVYVRKLIENGTLGALYYMYTTRVNLGIVRSTENAFESLAPHDLAVALDLFNEKPVAVSAHGQAYLQKGIADVSFATVYLENGKMAHIHTSWLDPQKARKVTLVGSRMMAVIDDMQESDKVSLFDKGVDIQPDVPHFEDYANAMRVRSGDIRIPRITMREPLAIELEQFVASIRTGIRPRSDGRNGLAVMRIMDAALRSMKACGACIEL